MLKLTRLTVAISLLKRKMSTQEPEILFETLNNAGIITMKRPKALNAMTRSMMTNILTQLQKWENSQNLVIVKGSDDKAFCMGGDIKMAIDKIEGPKMFRAQYKTINQIGNYKLPYVALINGFTMGGGMGISVHGRYRVVTEKTEVAMPETRIGLFPDAGGSYFLPRLRFNLGLYLGLTGERLKGRDVVKAGIGTHFIPSNRLHELETLLSRCTSDLEVDSLLTKFNEPTEEFSLAPYIKDINYCFAASNVEEIIERLENVGNDWSVKTLEILHQVRPGSLKITLRALQRGSQLDLRECLKMEYRLACRAIENHDFSEGVRAVLIDKDNSPNWNLETLVAVTDHYTERHFKILPDKELQFVKSKL